MIFRTGTAPSALVEDAALAGTACDAASRSEIVIPIHRNGEVIAVLDIDSPIKDRFSEKDKEGSE